MGSVKGFHHMFSLKRIVIKDYLFMIIENLIEVLSEWVYLNGFIEWVQCRGSVQGFSEGVSSHVLFEKDCHKGLFVYDY